MDSLTVKECSNNGPVSGKTRSDSVSESVACQTEEHIDSETEQNTLAMQIYIDILGILDDGETNVYHDITDSQMGRQVLQETLCMLEPKDNVQECPVEDTTREAMGPTSGTIDSQEPDSDPKDESLQDLERSILLYEDRLRSNLRSIRDSARDPVSHWLDSEATWGRSRHSSSLSQWSSGQAAEHVTFDRCFLGNDEAVEGSLLCVDISYPEKRTPVTSGDPSPMDTDLPLTNP